MKHLTMNQMQLCNAGSNAVSCIGGALGWAASIAGLALLSAGTAGLGAVALGIISFEANGVLAGIYCGKWAAES